MRKVAIEKRNHYRAILTDTLPYEVPLFFTNEPLFHWLSNDSERQACPTHFRQLLLGDSPRKPFQYKVRKTGGGLRNLAIPHPAIQVRFADFYRDFDAFIENVCSRSRCSLRYPTRVGSHFFQSQHAAAQEIRSSVDSDPASFSKQRKWASSYFSYQRFNHIQKFFSSKEFLRLEQKFAFMLKLDISRCFESIYTHSIAWAIRGKEFGKDNRYRLFFESKFDHLMQDANWGETNGILIGPEVSRIFAESILQSIDVELSERVAGNQHKITIARYVDDFFIFGNSKDSLANAQKSLEDVASKFNLHLNQSKTELVERPFVAPFAVARQQVKRELSELLRRARSNISEEKPTERFSARAADKVVAAVRRIARENDVDYSMLASPALAVLASGAQQLRRRTKNPLSKAIRSRVAGITNALLSISTFFYLMDIRAATSHKLARIFLECSSLNGASETGRLAFEGMIQDSLRLALEQARLTDITGPEIVNVLIAAEAVCSKLKGIPEDFLKLALGVDSDWDSACSKFNYFELVTALYFVRRKYSLRRVAEAACLEIEKRIYKVGSKLADYTEETMLFFDFISCPHIPEARRIDLFSKVAAMLGSNATPETTKLHFDKISKSLCFVAWNGAVNFQAMLARRELRAAYDS